MNDEQMTKVEILSRTLGMVKIENVASYDFIKDAIGVVSLTAKEKIIDSFYLKDIIEFATPGRITDLENIIPVTIEVTLNDGKTITIPDVVGSRMNEYGYLVFSQYTNFNQEENVIITMDRFFFEETIVRIRTIQTINKSEEQVQEAPEPVVEPDTVETNQEAINTTASEEVKEPEVVNE